MARLTLSDLVDEARNLYEDIRPSKVKFAANFILRDLDKERLAPIRGRASFTTKAPVEGTASPTQGSVTVPSTLAALEHKDQKIQIDGSVTWYIIDDVDVGVSYTLDAGYDGPTDTDVVCRVVFDRYSLVDGLVGLKTIRREDKQPLKKVVDETDIFGIESLRTAEPVKYYETFPRIDPNRIEVVLVNPPDNIYTYLINGTYRLTRYDDDSSMTDIPEEFEHCLLSGVFWIISTFEEGVETASFWKSWYNQLKKDFSKTRTPAAGPAFTPLIAGPPVEIPVNERYSHDA